jgi:hypothetical protein
MRTGYRGLVLVTLLAVPLSATALGSCKNCKQRDCPGSISFALSTESGDPVVARGEVRNGASVTQFDCAPQGGAADPGSWNCVDGEFQVTALFHPPRPTAVRFELRDDGWTDWAEVAVESHTEVEKDFNGPGCDCTRRNGTAEPIVVPTQAQWTSEPRGAAGAAGE